jgi:prepilin-type N-terminal cleavage/methylation domain-containing protein
MKNQKSKIKDQRYASTLRYFFINHQSSIIINHKKAFTLIELLVSIAIIMLLVGLSFAGYSRFSQRQALISAGQTLKNTLRDAQSRAFNGEQDCSICDCTAGGFSSLTGWYADLGNRNFYGICGGNEFPVEHIDMNISSDITITTDFNPPGNTILFRVYPPGADKRGTICLSDAKMPNTFYAITIDYSGALNDQTQLVDQCPQP